MNPSVNYPLALIGRILLALIFIVSGLGKIGGFAGTAGYIASKGLPAPQVLAVLSILVEVGAGIALIIGFKARWAALALAGFCVVSGVIFHNFWALPPEQQMIQQIMFMKNLSMAGGLLMVAALGAGGWSIDSRRPA